MARHMREGEKAREIEVDYRDRDIKSEREREKEIERETEKLSRCKQLLQCASVSIFPKCSLSEFSVYESQDDIVA